MKTLTFVLCLVLFSTGSQAYSGLGKNPQEFQAIKARVVEQIKGTEATVSEIVPPTFNEDQLAQIRKAQKELAQ